MKNTLFFFAVVTVLLNTAHGMHLVASVDTLLYGGASLGETKDIDIFVGILDTTPHYMISNTNRLFRGNLLHQNQIFAVNERAFSSEITDVAVIPDNVSAALVAAIAEADTGIKYFIGDTGTDWVYREYIPVEGIPVKIKRTPEKYLVTLTDQGIFIHDCSKVNPTLIANCITPANDPKDIVVEGDKAYVLGYNVLLVFQNIFNKDSIAIDTVSSVDTSLLCLDVNNGVIFAGGVNKFCVFADDPGCSKIDEVAVNGTVTDITFFENKIYAGITKAAASDFQGIQAYDATDPANIVFLDSCETPGGIGEMLFYGNYIRATLGNAGVALIDYSVPTNIKKHPSLQSGNTMVFAIVSGNGPGNTIKISYELVHPAPISIALYNLQGKCVWTLFDGQKGEGTHRQEFPTDKMISGMHVLLIKAGDAVLSTVSFPFVR